mmetsp:Transcript_628/g.1431  ORF Transcript_628/g.1431 Transcript_628/m.1431 type:complete len:258 (+) Transcript_628:132-905(+)
MNLTSLPSTRLGSASAPATACGLVGPSATRWGGLDSSNLLLLSLKTEGLALASQLRWPALLELLVERRVVSSSALSSLLVVVILESTHVLLMMLHGSIGISHTLPVVAHSVGLSTVSAVLGIVLVLVLVVAVGVSATVSAASALVLVTSGSGMVRVSLMALVIVMRGTVATTLSHHLGVSKSTLNCTSELLCMASVSIVVTNSLLLVSTHGIKLVLGSSVLGSVVEGRITVWDSAWHARRNTGSWCRSGGGGSGLVG